jgi:signal transduction histidine kinase
MRSLFPRTIQGRLIFSHLLVSLISVALISAYSGHIVFSVLRQQIEREYADLISAIASDINVELVEHLAGRGTLDPVRASIEPIFAGQGEVRYTIYLPDGSPLLDRSGTLPPKATQAGEPEVWEALNSESGQAENFRGDGQGAETFFLARRIEHEGAVVGILLVASPVESALMPARASLGLIVSAALIVGLAMSVAGFILARGIAGPIESMTRSAESLATGRLDSRVVPPSHPQEVHRLAEAFNNMAVRLQTHVDELRSFVANASHELRTPLTSIKLRVEALRNGALDDPPVTERFLEEIEGEVDRLSTMVNDLLDLSRIEAGLDPSRRAQVDMANVANDVYEAFRVRADRAEINLRASVQSGLPPVLGNDDQLRRLLYNLVDNAIKYTSRGGSVEIGLKAGERSGNLVLTVSDTGYGIAPAQLPHVFERFYRVEATRPRFGPSHGSGLGLPIARSIAEAHGGAIGVTSQLGVGSTFWVELPVFRLS